MTGQFVDLFDREKHGLNYWAGIAVCLGLLVAFGFEAIEISYRTLVDGVTYLTPDREPMTLGAVLLRNLRGSASSAVGFGFVLVASGAFLKKDLLLPFGAGLLAVPWDVVTRVVGFVEGPAMDPGLLVNSFVWTFLVVGSFVLCYRFFSNKLIALSFGMAIGSLFWGIISAIRYDVPLSYFAESAAQQLCLSFIAGVFLFGGIARHFSSRGMRFGEYGLATAPESVMDDPTTDSALGKTRRPLVTLLLMVVTLNLYAFGWIYQIYSEIRRRQDEATSITPGKALGFLFIPVFNFFWALWLWLDLPHAIERMERADPPSGVSPDRWVITGSLFACSVMGLIGGFWWFPALYLNAVFLWTGVLLAQSSLNSHWEAHRGGQAAA